MNIAQSLISFFVPKQNSNSGHRHDRNCNNLVFNASPGGAKACSLGRKPQDPMGKAHASPGGTEAAISRFNTASAPPGLWTVSRSRSWGFCPGSYPHFFDPCGLAPQVKEVERLERRRNIHRPLWACPTGESGWEVTGGGSALYSKRSAVPPITVQPPSPAGRARRGRFKEIWVRVRAGAPGYMLSPLRGCRNPAS